MAWFYLLIAGIMEIAWAVGLKYTEGFTRLWPTVGSLAALVLSFVLLTMAVKHIPLGTAYAVWTGIGTVGTVALAIMLFGEDASPLRLAFIALIVIGCIGLKVAFPEH